MVKKKIYYSYVGSGTGFTPNYTTVYRREKSNADTLPPLLHKQSPAALLMLPLLATPRVASDECCDVL
jgi:hypothetical protein